MSRLKRRIQQARRRGCYVIQWPGHLSFDVYVEGEWCPRNLVATKRQAVALAYRISVAKRQKLVITAHPA